MPAYKIVVNGDVLPGFDVNTVKDNIAETFKMADPEMREKALAKIFSGNPMTFKKGLSQEQAAAYERAMNKAGLECKILSESPDSGLELSSTQASSASSANPQPGHSDAPGQKADSANPYAQPTADLETPSEEGEFVLVDPQKISASGGIDWIKEGFYYFKQAPLGWIGMMLLFLVITIVLSIIPFVSIVVNIINPVFVAGFMIACYRLSQGEPFDFKDLFAGFKKNFSRLAAVGLIYLISIIVVVAITFGIMFVVVGQEQMATLAQAPDPSALGIPFLILFLAILGLMSAVIMAYIFAPALVVMHDVTAVEAMKLSFKGCMRNILPFLLYGIVALLLSVLAIIPFGLGMLILMPVMTASLFAAYRQIFTKSSIQ